jgi:hypothetical protein
MTRKVPRWDDEAKREGESHHKAFTGVLLHHHDNRMALRHTKKKKEISLKTK